MPKWNCSLVLILSIAALSFSDPQEPAGFKDIGFGTPKEEVMDKLIAVFKLEKLCRDTSIYVGENELQLQESADGSYVLKNFMLADRLYMVTFLFNEKGLFYLFRISGAQCAPDQIAFCVGEDVNFLKDLFIIKYGEPRSSRTMKDIKMQGYPFYKASIVEWKTDDCYMSIDIQKIVQMYSAHAIVCKESLKIKKESRDMKLREAATFF